MFSQEILTMSSSFKQCFVLYNIVCSKRVFLIALTRKRRLQLTNLEMLISASFIAKHESSNRYVSQKYFKNLANSF